MNTMMLIKCDWCGKESEKLAAEVKRRRSQGKNFFFCCRSHAAEYSNEIRGDKKVEIQKTCPQCGGVFKTMTGAKSATFCSRGCASAGSVTEYRRERARQVGFQNHYAIDGVESIASSLRVREAWKYKKVEELLEFLKINFQFELAVGNFVFDLALPDSKLLVEFDGPYHDYTEKTEEDRKKDEFAKGQGWNVVRVSVPQNVVIEPNAVYGLLTGEAQAISKGER